MTGNKTGSRTLGVPFPMSYAAEANRIPFLHAWPQRIRYIIFFLQATVQRAMHTQAVFFFFNLVTGICLGPSVCQARTAPLRDTHNSVFFPFSHPDRFSQCDFVPQADCELEIFLLPPCVIRSKQKSLQMTHYTTEGLGISLWEEF